MSAATRLKDKLEKMRQSAATKAQKSRKQMRAIGIEAAGQTGGAISAISLGALDAKYASSEGVTTFGESEVPVAPVGGAVLMLAALPLIKISPHAAAFLGRAGMFALDMGLYNFSREKFEAMLGE